MPPSTDEARSIPRSKKEKFLRDLDEDAFRDDVVRPLFFRLGYKDGRDLCGPFEKGKDAVFSETNRLGQQDIIAVQTKKGNLNLTSSASVNLSNATAQLRTALETSIPLLSDRRKALPSKVFLCASGKINEAARHHVVEEIRDPRITFLDADELIPLIDDNLPEFWLGIDADLLPYFRAMKDLVEGGRSRDSREPVFKSDILIGAATDANFISLTLFRTTLVTKKFHGNIEQVPEIEEISLERIAATPARKILILGDAGSGKSTALLRIAYQSVRSGITSSRSYRIPVFIRAADIARAKPDTLITYLESSTRAISNSSRGCFSSQDLREGRVQILLDALDEVSDEAERKRIIDLVNEFSQSYHKVQFIVTSRPHPFTSEFKTLAAFAQYTISPIGWKEASKIIQNLQEGKRVPPQNSKELLRRLQHVHGIELNPLLVTVFAATSEYGRQDIPANITELFKKFTELMLGRWDENKGLSQQYQAPLKDFLLTKVAFEMHSREVTRISLGEMREMIRNELATRGHKSSEDQIIDELVTRSGLFRVVANDIEFRHHLLQEFFAGRGIPTVSFIETVIDKDWWKRAIVFFFGERPSDVASLRGIFKKAMTLEPSQIYDSTLAIGLALQACYLSEVKDKIELWKEISEAISAARDAIEATQYLKKYPLIGFVAYYMVARDSIALSNIRDYLEDLREWSARSTFGTKEEIDAKRFWLICALIEIGDATAAEELMRDYNPSDPRFLLALHLGAYLTEHIREVDEKEKIAARGIVRRLEQPVAEMRHQIVKELGSQLLEIRNGSLTSLAIDADENRNLQLPMPT